MRSAVAAGLAAIAIVATISCVVYDSQSPAEYIKEVPSWVESEEDLEIYLQGQAKAGHKIIRHDTATHRIVSAEGQDGETLLQLESPRHAEAAAKWWTESPVDEFLHPAAEEDFVQTEAASAPVTMMEVPKYIT